MTARLLDAAALGLSLLTLFAAGAFFWRDKKIAGVAFLVAFVVALASVSQQRIVFSSFVGGITVENGAQPQPER